MKPAEKVKKRYKDLLEVLPGLRVGTLSRGPRVGTLSRRERAGAVSRLPAGLPRGRGKRRGAGERGLARGRRLAGERVLARERRRLAGERNLDRGCRAVPVRRGRPRERIRAEEAARPGQ